MDPGADYEGKVTGLWNLILQHYFPASEGYVHRPQDKVMGGFLDFNSISWAEKWGDSTKKQKMFLVTQCKRQSRETGEQAWEEGRNQLRRYLHSVMTKETEEREKRIPAVSFGIVAVGQRCSFFTFFGGSRTPYGD